MSVDFNDKGYWVKYYNKLIKEDITLGPSPFAQFLVGQSFVQHSMNIVELGCGNGRDSKYFARLGAKVFAIDQCPNITALLDKEENITSIPADFTRLENYDDGFDLVYSRFTMHSINEDSEDRTLKWSYRNLKKGGLLCVEARTTKDPLYGKGIHKGNNVWYYDKHHRRFINSESFKKKLKEIGFELLLYKEDNGFAKFKDEDPIVLRSIVRK